MSYKTHTVLLSVNDFRYNWLEKMCGLWGDSYFNDTFDKYVKDGFIEIEYQDRETEKYTYFRVVGTDKAYRKKLINSADKQMENIRQEAEAPLNFEKLEDIERIYMKRIINHLLHIDEEKRMELIREFYVKVLERTVDSSHK